MQDATCNFRWLKSIHRKLNEFSVDGLTIDKVITYNFVPFAFETSYLIENLQAPRSKSPQYVLLFWVLTSGDLLANYRS